MASFSDQFNLANRDIFSGNFGNSNANKSPLGFDYNAPSGNVGDLDTLSKFGSGLDGGESPGSSWSLWGGGDTNSIVGTGVGLAGAGLDAFLGLKQLGLAEDALDFKKSAFSQQFENQRSMVNTELRDRQTARVSADPTGHQSVEDYMKASGI